jgi:hypothetical protein
LTSDIGKDNEQSTSKQAAPQALPSDCIDNIHTVILEQFFLNNEHEREEQL